MAISTFGNFQPLAPGHAQPTHHICPPPTSPNTPPAGSLIVHDNFDFEPRLCDADGNVIPSPFKMPVHRNSNHGEQVRHAAEYDGFQGQVVERQMMPTMDYQIAQNAEATLVNGPLNRQQAQNAVDNYFTGRAKGLLETEARLLNQDTASGARNTVVNISQGESQASLTRDFYGKPFGMLNHPDPQQRQYAETMIQNQATAFGLDSGKLLSEDPEVHGPERQRLQQAISDRAGHILQENPHVQGARQRYDEAVSSFEANNNSVVISAGNWGTIKDDLAAMNHGRPIDTPETFETNVLENDAVTSVGATRWFENDGQLSEYPAKYSSRSPGVDIHASGSVGYIDPQRAETHGTSYASPRTAAAMAELHRQNPNLSSAQIETLMQQRLTHGLNTQAGEIQVLDYGKTFEFLRNGTY